MLVQLSEILKEAQRKHIAVGAFNIGNLDIFEAIVQAAEDEVCPTIIECSVPEYRYLGKEFFSYVKKRLEDSNVPFVLHLDHGNDLDIIKEAISAGFNSVMIDTSLKPFQENVAYTKEVVSYSYAHQVNVEAELGTIGSTESSSCSDGTDTKIIYTDPIKAKEFVELTGIDALAIAIGTSHGMYAHGQYPKLRLDILDKIRELTSVPLVLHGGSGNADEEIKEAIAHGISKINISSEVKEAYFCSLKEYMESHPKECKTQIIFAPARKAAYEVVKNKMLLFKSNATQNA